MTTIRAPDDEEDRERREMCRSAQPDGPLRDVYTFEWGNGLSFKIKKPAFDPKGAIDGQFAEEDVRVEFFYPYIEGAVFFDIGAAHGSWTLPALALGARVVAFEPDPRYTESLRDSILINEGFHERTQLFQNGVYAKSCYGNFDELENISVTTIDECVRALKIAPSFVKIDVEGNELGVLRGAVKTLSLIKPLLLIENHHQEWGERWLKEHLEPLGYRWKMGPHEEAFSYLFFY